MQRRDGGTDREKREASQPGRSQSASQLAREEAGKQNGQYVIR